MKRTRSVFWLLPVLIVVSIGCFFVATWIMNNEADSELDNSDGTIGSPISAFVLHNERLLFDDHNASFGVALADADRDGDTDIWLTQHGRGSVILRNRIAEELGTFERLETREGFDQHGATWVDLDRDGIREVLVMHGGGKGGKVYKPMNVLGNRLLVNEGADPKELQFVFGDDANSESDSRGLYYSLGRARTATFLDVNQDGLLDVFLGNEPRPDHGFPSIWFIQQKDHTFVRDRETLESKAMASHSQFPPTLTAMGRWISF